MIVGRCVYVRMYALMDACMYVMCCSLMHVFVVVSLSLLRFVFSGVPAAYPLRSLLRMLAVVLCCITKTI